MITKRRVLNLKNLGDVLAKIRRLHTAGYAQLGQWDLAQICHHFATPIEQTMEDFAFRGPLPVRLFILVTGPDPGSSGAARSSPA